MQAFWQLLLQLLLAVLVLFFWCWLLRWFLGIYHLSAKLDQVLEELKEIKYKMGDRSFKQPSSQPEEVVPQEEQNVEPQDEDKPDEPTTCMRCGQTIPAESSTCPACGWTWRPVEKGNA